MAKKKLKKVTTYGPGTHNPVEKVARNSGSCWNEKHLQWLFIELHHLSVNQWQMPNVLSEVEKCLFNEIDRLFGWSWTQILELEKRPDTDNMVGDFYLHLASLEDYDSSSSIHGSSQSDDNRRQNSEDEEKRTRRKPQTPYLRLSTQKSSPPCIYQMLRRTLSTIVGRRCTMRSYEERLNQSSHHPLLSCSKRQRN
ncbi:uncharacterized protein BDZ99DRAFT_233307 [Mytilinidion resinicola]|uniref:Uncharacterized protein n=1 Tax=Mytilinidion resinicola TaxID=574789 RepID=A0A6A6Z1U2_9PEZI|nr:uncharacterized protein BDZ99DRAFT_233307 [Mytilinidion resinicola]KAF2814207.1 hypothetical protein BDZ99DRAFT_233307 [Mytilinidion resinicola]